MESEEKDTEAGLGGDIEDGVEENLSVGVDVVDTFTESPDDGVSEPEQCGIDRQAKIRLADLVVTGVSGLAGGDEEDVEDVEEEEAREGVEAESRLQVRVEGGEETREDHAEVSNDQEEKVGVSEASEETEVEEQERGGDGPVGVSSPEDFTNGVVAGSVDEGVARVRGHGKVSDGSERGDADSDLTREETKLSGLAEGEDAKEDRRQRHDGEDDPESAFTSAGDLHHALVVRKLTDGSVIVRPVSVSGRVLENLNSLVGKVVHCDRWEGGGEGER